MHIGRLCAKNVRQETREETKAATKTGILG
nr:MAG TPA: hypothetical protein [Caudoviricetes sp.]